MNAKPIIGALVALLLLSVVAMPAAAAPGAADAPAEQVDDCKNAENGPDGEGPPGFVADLVPDFVSGLMADLPVPNFVKATFGAETC